MSDGSQCGLGVWQDGARCARVLDHTGAHHRGFPCVGGCGRLVSIYCSSTGYCSTCRRSKACARCGKTLYTHNRSDLCTPCKTKIGAAIRRVGLNQIKLAVGCADCGYRAHPDALVFSHIRGEGRQSVALLLNCAWQRVLDEIAKCDVTCANCHSIRNTRRLREEFREHQHSRGSAGYLARREVVAQAKLAVGCVDCGYRAHAEALQFDHGDDEEKTAGIGRMTGSARDALADEMAKCAVRCANCHAIRTAKVAGWDRSARSSWKGVSEATRSWALGKAREVSVIDEGAVAAVVARALTVRLVL